jgi:transcriptional regulatory protein LEU3
MRHSQAPGSVTDPNYAGSTASPNVDMQNMSPQEPGSGTYSDLSGGTDGSHSMSPGTFEQRQETGNAIPIGTTSPRSLDGYVLDPKRIDDCFRL